MPAMKSSAVALLLSSNESTELWRAALSSQGVGVHGVEPGTRDPLLALRSDLKARPANAAIIDIPFFAASACEAPREVAEIRRAFAGLRIFLRLPRRVHVSEVEQRWASEWGVDALLPATSLGAWRRSVNDPLAAVLRSIGPNEPDADNLQRSLKALLDAEAPQDPGVARHFADLRRLEKIGVDPLRILDELRSGNGVRVEDRSWRGKSFRECFVASEAVERVVHRLGVSAETAVFAGRALQGMGLIHHVAREQTFADENLFFRFGAGDGLLERIPLSSLVEEMRAPAGVGIADRRYLGKVYPRCFVGNEAVDWLRAHCGVAVGEAENLGQRMLELGLLHHVTDDHPFVDGPFFYRFLSDDR